VTAAIDPGERLDVQVDSALEGDLAHATSALDFDDTMFVDERNFGHVRPFG